MITNEDYQDYLSIPRNQVIQIMKKHLKPDRLEHCLRVEKLAKELALKNGEDVQKAGLAGLLHDFAKNESLEVLLSYSKHEDFDPEWKDWGRAIWHGPLAAMMAEDKLGLTDKEIYNAIFNHTVGSFNWTPTAKIVFLADYIEPHRDFKGVEEARKATDKSLDEGVSFKLSHSIQFLASQHQPIYPQTIKVYNQWFKKGRSNERK